MVKRANKRMPKKRKQRKLLILAAEGANKTEKTYFTEFNDKQSEYRVIPARGNNTDPVKIVRDAINSAEKEDVEFEAGDRVFAVFDVDFGKEKQIREAMQLAKANNVEVVLSNPCFEVWFLVIFASVPEAMHRMMLLLQIWFAAGRNITRTFRRIVSWTRNCKTHYKMQIA